MQYAKNQILTILLFVLYLQIVEKFNEKTSKILSCIDNYTDGTIRRW